VNILAALSKQWQGVRLLKWRDGGGNKESIENLACNLTGSAMTLFQGISITAKLKSLEARCQAEVQKYGAFLTADLDRG
jgi:hypothetical protein